VQDTLNSYISLGFKAGPGMPLPVQLVRFTAVADLLTQTALLNWQVAAENKVTGYNIERSADARLFNEVGKVAASGKRDYTFTDVAPLKGINYYRLKMKGADGTFTYSEVRALLFRGTGDAYAVYPNPVNNELLLLAAAPAAGMPVTITDLSGRLVQQFVATGTVTRINTTGWTAGTYLVKLADGKVFKIVKQ